MKKKIIILGCTGSIGTSTLNIIREFSDKFSVAGLTAHSSEIKLQQLANEFNNPPTLLTKNANVEDLKNFIAKCNADIAVNGIAGSAGLIPSILVLEAGLDLALANKETIVMAGEMIKKLAKKNNSRILPVDSEHSAIFSLIEKYGKDSIQEIILTASGGPFRNLQKSELSKVTVKDALKHPTWNMGQKITIDSASLANKGLEVIEACKLFDINPENIKVVVHPQSLVHSLIRTKDGVVYAQISPPDMRHPILTALTWPNFLSNSLEQLDFSKQFSLDFIPPRFSDFPMLDLAYKALKKRGAYTIAYNAANEIAVEAFLQNKIKFTDISKITNKILDMEWSENPVTFDQVFLFDKQIRETANDLIASVWEE